MKKEPVYFLAKCSKFTSESAHEDDNGFMPVVLTPIAGQAPRGIVVVAGTIAQEDRENFQPGNVYLVMGVHTETVETEDGERVESFNYTNIAQFDVPQMLAYVKENPLQAPLIAPRGSDAGAPQSEIRIVKNNPNARRIREASDKTVDNTAKSKAEPETKKKAKS